jgi:peptide subunit release factor 1 (eRF1)
MQMGQIEEKGEWIGEDVKHHKQGGHAAARYQRHVEKHAEQNLKLAAEASVRFCEENLCKGMVLGIAADTLPQFEAMLPKAWQKKIVGTIAVDMAAPVNELMDRSVELIHEEERKQEQRLATRMITAAAKGGGAVIGLADTFYVAHQGRVHTLVVEKDFEADGYLCNQCGYVSAEPIGKCPFCGGQPQPIRGAVNRVIQKVIQSGGTVQTVRYTDLAKAGHIGAILRY